MHIVLIMIAVALMKFGLNVRGPEAIGLTFVCATLGAVMFGAAAHGVNAHSMLGALLGAGVAFVLVNGRVMLKLAER